MAAFIVGGFICILKLARTIADLDGEEQIASRHLSEAILYRGMDGKSV